MVLSSCVGFRWDVWSQSGQQAEVGREMGPGPGSAAGTGTTLPAFRAFAQIFASSSLKSFP
jgi:hypothetical protein